MAEQRGKFLRGVLGGQVFRVVNNKQQVSTKPLRGTVKQNKATKRASNTFGMASGLGSQIRSTVSTEVLQSGDGSLTNRLNTELIAVLNECRNPSTKLYQFAEDSFGRLKDFEYDVNNRVGQLMTARPQVTIADGQLVVSLPQLDVPSRFKFPRDSFQCNLQVLVSLFRLADGKFGKVPDLQQIEITKNKELLEGRDLVFSIPSGCLCVVSLFLNYSFAGKRGWEPIKNFYPGCICGALINPGPYKGDVRRTWLKAIAFEM